MPSHRVSRLSLSPTLAVAELARRLRAEGRDIIDLSVGEPDFPSPDGVKEAGRRAIDEDRTRYTATEGIPELRGAIADHLRHRRGLTCTAEQVVVSPGAKASLYFAFQALCDPGDEVLVPSPYWTSYPEQVRLAGAEPVFVACEESTGFRLTAARLEEAIRPRSRVLVLNYPTNPTGAGYTAEELAPLAEVALRHDLWVIADEIYSSLVYGGFRFSSIAALGADIAARTVVIDGMSKSYSMTGWRLGYAVGPREIARAMTNLQSHSTSHATSISQWAGLAALGLDDDVLAPRLAAFQERRDEVLRRLARIPGVRCVEPRGAFYAFPNVSGCFRHGMSSGEACARYLLERAEVAVVPGEAFGSAAHVRLSFATSVDRLRRGLGRLAEALGTPAEG
jgi:aspartate aminotransferase